MLRDELVKAYLDAHYMRTEWNARTWAGFAFEELKHFGRRRATTRGRWNPLKKRWAVRPQNGSEVIPVQFRREAEELIARAQAEIDRKALAALQAAAEAAEKAHG